MKYEGLIFRNEGQKTVEIDVEGIIGGSWWFEDENPDSKNTKEKMKAELERIANLDAETIIVNINSYGGDVNHGLSIHDLLAEHKAKIITKVNGMTASAATIIAMAGEERRMSDNALFLIHNASACFCGDKNDFSMAHDALKTIDERIAKIYSKVNGKTVDEMLELMNSEKGNGKWLSADEAKELGLITDIFEPLKAAALYSNDQLQRFGLPPIPEDKLKTGEYPVQKLNEQNIVDRVLAGVEKFFANKKSDNKNSTEMKKFDKINNVLGVSSLEATDEGVFLNEEQLQSIENALNTEPEIPENFQDTAPLNESLDEIDETVAGAGTTAEKITAVGALVAGLRQNPGSPSAKAVKETDDPKEEGSAVAKGVDFMADMEAVRNEYL